MQPQHEVQLMYLEFFYFKGILSSGVFNLLQEEVAGSLHGHIFTVLLADA